MIPLLLALACTPAPDPGTVVGNPGDAFARIAPPTSDLTIDSASVWLDALVMTDCQGNSRRVWVQRQIDLVQGDLSLSLPAGDWCEVGLDVWMGMRVSGQGPDGSSFQLMLGPDLVELLTASSFTVDGQQLVVELGQPDWLSADLLDLQGGMMMMVTDSSDLYQPLSDAIALDSAIFDDSDGDGRLSDAERQQGSL